ncbi:MAG: GNAT family N-acetyltransferase [Candidatus Bathyarchaeia archaeon]|jgi:CelD/BcsL family acetyltransferase involved in cellulose biosynthesis
MRIIEVNKYDDFLALEEAWNDILKRCGRHTVFSTWEWLTTWWKHFGKDKKLLLLLAKENDTILGIAPLMYSVHKMFGLRMGKIEFIGTGTSDYNDFILTKRTEECLRLFIDYLYDLPENWKCVDLIDIQENSNSLLFLRRISSLKPVHECSYFILPNSYEAFLMNNLKRKQRKHVYRNARNLERAFKVEVLDCSNVQSFTEGMQCLFELHQKRWESRGFEGIFADGKSRDFHLDIARAFSQKEWLGLDLLTVSGKKISANYGFKYHSKYYAYITGFDPEYTRYSVGNVLVAYSIRRSIDEGLTEYDFLRGAEEYKIRWNTISRWNSRAILIRKGIAANIELRLYYEYWNQGNRLKSLLKIPYEHVPAF